jgi:SAM-dependent methyltransferase
MNPLPLQVQIDVANAYEALMVPALFGRKALEVADAANIAPGQRVLDVACGTGILSREAMSRVGLSGFVAGLDRNAGMLHVAKQLAPEIEWHRGDAESLPFPDQSFDVVVSQFGLMFFQDRTEAIREVLRVLKPSGRFAIAVWNSLANIPAYATEVRLLEQMAGAEAADAVSAPFVLGNHDDLHAVFKQAGAPPVEITTARSPAIFPSVRTMFEADLRGWLPMMGVVLSEETIERILAAAERELAPLVNGDGTIAFECSALIVTGAKS